MIVQLYQLSKYKILMLYLLKKYIFMNRYHENHEDKSKIA